MKKVHLLFEGIGRGNFISSTISCSMPSAQFVLRILLCKTSASSIQWCRAKRRYNGDSVNFWKCEDAGSKGSLDSMCHRFPKKCGMEIWARRRPKNARICSTVSYNKLLNVFTWPIPKNGFNLSEKPHSNLSLPQNRLQGWTLTFTWEVVSLMSRWRSSRTA